MARSPLPPVRERAFDDEDINPEISDVIDGIQLERTLAIEDAASSGLSASRIAVIAVVAVVVIWMAASLF